MPSLLRPRCHHVFIVMAMMLLVCAHADTQTAAQTGAGSVNLTARVSETVALSIPPSFTLANIDSDVVRSGNTVRLTLSSTNGESPVIRVPLQVRSNSDFKISAVCESQAAVLTELSVIDVRATGTLVSPQVVSALDVKRQSDRRGADEISKPNPLDLSQPLFVLSGPRVSLGGTLESPNNALQVTMLIRLQPQSDRAWSLHLTFVGTPE